MEFIIYAAAFFFILSIFLRMRSVFSAADIFLHAGGLLIAASFLFLAVKLARVDTAYLYVAQHLSANTPLVYRLSALWSGQEGSLLLWVLLLYLTSLIIRHDRTALTIHTVVISVFSLILAVSSNPFIENSMNIPGAGLNPLLENFWFAIHPPLLFAGYTFAVLISSITASSLIQRNKSILLNHYSSIIFGFALLLSGIITGGVWAYSVLGWGGYWSWDPVENLSLIPCLILFIIIHLIPLFREEKISHTSIAVYALLLILSVVISTGLTRSGLLSNSSVHSFANSSGGFAFIIFAGFIAAAAIFILYKFKSSEKIFNLTSTRDKALYLTTTATVVYTVPVFLLTIAPVLVQAAGTGFSVNRGIYDTLTIAFGFILLSIFIYNQCSGISKKIIFFVCPVCIIVLYVRMIVIDLSFTTLAILAMIIVYICFLIVKSFLSKRFDYNSIVHIGLVVMIAGIALAEGSHCDTGKITVVKGKISELKKNKIELIDYDNKNTALKINDVVTKYKTGQVKTLVDSLIIKSFTGDIFLTPLEFISKDKASTQIRLVGTDPLTVNNISIAFVDYNTKEDADGFHLNVTLAVTNKNHNMQVTLRSTADYSGKLKNAYAQIPFTGISLALVRLDLDSKKLILNSNKVLNINAADSLTIEYKEKRFVSVIWIGAVILIAGLFAMPIRLYFKRQL